MYWETLGRIDIDTQVLCKRPVGINPAGRLYLVIVACKFGFYFRIA